MGNTPQPKGAVNASYTPKFKTHFSSAMDHQQYKPDNESFKKYMNHQQNTPISKTNLDIDHSIVVDPFHGGSSAVSDYFTSPDLTLYPSGPIHVWAGNAGIVVGGSKMGRSKIASSKKGGSLAGGASDPIVVHSYHVSCKSDKPKSYSSGDNLAGIVLYSKNGKSQWTCNGVKCRAGYIILKKSKNVNHLVTNDGSAIHGKVYKSVFGSDPDLSIVRSGFARVTGTWKYNSWSCNAADNGYTDRKKQMNSIEKAAVKTAIQKWICNGTQNTYPSSTIYINPN